MDLDIASFSLLLSVALIPEYNIEGQILLSSENAPLAKYYIALSSENAKG